MPTSNAHGERGGVRIRPLQIDDVEAAAALCAAVGLGGAAANLARFIAWQPGCGVAADADGALVGCVTVLRWGHVGFVGCMAVSAERQGTGLGRALLEHAQARTGAATYLLEATPAGERLYARLGYVVSGETLIMTREPAAHAGAATNPVPAATALGRRLAIASKDDVAAPADINFVASAKKSPIAAAERDAMLAIDRAGTGLDRRDMIDGLVQLASAIRVVPEHGYGLAVGDQLGPLVAQDDETARALIASLVEPCSVVAAPVRPEIIDALAAHGFRESRLLRRMRLGPDVPAPLVWALASPGAG